MFLYHYIPLVPIIPMSVIDSRCSFGPGDPRESTTYKSQEKKKETEECNVMWEVFSCIFAVLHLVSSKNGEYHGIPWNTLQAFNSSL